jgi:hypothetical protein
LATLTRTRQPRHSQAYAFVKYYCAQSIPIFTRSPKNGTHAQGSKGASALRSRRRGFDVGSHRPTGRNRRERTLETQSGYVSLVREAVIQRANVFSKTHTERGGMLMEPPWTA